MGHAHVPDQNNALYGFKTEIREILRNRETPYWVEDKPTYFDVNYRKPVEDAFEKAAKKVREKRKEYNSKNLTEPIYFKFGRNVPSDITEKLDITRKKGQEYTGFHNCSPRDYFLKVEVGPRKGIEEICVVRDFHI